MLMLKSSFSQRQSGRTKSGEGISGRISGYIFFGMSEKTREWIG